MDKEHVKGAADKAKGAIKDAAGKMMNDKKMQAEGKIDKAKGAGHQAIGEATMADAICDRLIHNAHRIDLAGESLRRRRSRPMPKD